MSRRAGGKGTWQREPVKQSCALHSLHREIDCLEEALKSSNDESNRIRQQLQQLQAEQVPGPLGPRESLPGASLDPPPTARLETTPRTRQEFTSIAREDLQRYEREPQMTPSPMRREPEPGTRLELLFEKIEGHLQRIISLLERPVSRQRDNPNEQRPAEQPRVSSGQEMPSLASPNQAWPLVSAELAQPAVDPIFEPGFDPMLEQYPESAVDPMFEQNPEIAVDPMFEQNPETAIDPMFEQNPETAVDPMFDPRFGMDDAQYEAAATGFPPGEDYQAYQGYPSL